MKQAQRKILSVTHSNFKVEQLKDPDLKDQLQDSGNEDFSYCTCCQISLRNANKSMLLRYSNSDRHKSSSARFVTYRCPYMVDSTKIHLILCLPGVFRSNLGFLVSLYVFFQKIWLAALGISALMACVLLWDIFVVFPGSLPQHAAWFLADTHFCRLAENLLFIVQLAGHIDDMDRTNKYRCDEK